MSIVEIIAGQFEQMLANLIGFLPRLVAAIVLAVVFVFLTRWLLRVAGKAIARTKAPPQIVQLSINGLTVLAIAIGAIVVLGAMGVNVAGLVASVGLTGIVVGFALKDTLENLVAGTLLLIERPFVPGDAIKVGDYSGVVTDVVIRATTIRTFDGVEVIIPNNVVYTSAITNYSTYPTQRRELKLLLGYEENLARAIEVALASAKEVQGVVKDPAPSAWLSAFDAGAIILTIYFWVNTEERDVFSVHSDVLAAIQTAANREKLDVAPASTYEVTLREERSS
jgi:small conductance mechanosensitive channel